VQLDQRTEILRTAKPNSWLALSEDESRVVGVGDTYANAVEMAAQQGIEETVFIKTPEEWVALIL
jgi:ribonucleotide monophosphatase NagD (HAD superfamily)